MLKNLPLHQHMLDTFLEGVGRGEFTRSNLKAETTKAIYISRMNDLLVPPKVELKYPLTNFQEIVYQRLKNPVLEVKQKVKILKGNMVSYQRGPVEPELNKVVDKVCAPSAKVAYITVGDSKMIRVHLTPPEILDKEVTYFSSKNDLDRFRKTFLIDVLVESEEQAQKGG